MKKNQINNFLDDLWLLKPVLLEQSNFNDEIKKELLNVLTEKIRDTFIKNHIEECENKSWKFDFDFIFETRDVLVRNFDNQISLLEYCRSRWISPFIKEWDSFVLRTFMCSPRKQVFYKKINNNSVFALSLAHELWHALKYREFHKLMRQMDQETYSYLNIEEETDNFEQTTAPFSLLFEFMAWYEGLKILKYLNKKGITISQWIESFDKLCNLMDLCLVSKQNYGEGYYMLNRNKVKNILGNCQFPLSK